jgi:DNA-binding NarL/FixJ family response regulator
MCPKRIRIIVVDDHQLIIDGLKSLIQDEPDILFIGGANDMDEAMDLLSKNPVDVVLADVSFPGISGIEITKKIKERFPMVKVIALTMYEDYQTVTKMIEAGASGYILKRTNMSEVIEAIHVVCSNGQYLGRDVQAIMMNNIRVKERKEVENQDIPAVLTIREKEILNLIAKELTNEEIAKRLFISERTVETHRRNIFTKTKAKSIIGLIKYAISKELISPDGKENGS